MVDITDASLTDLMQIDKPMTTSSLQALQDLAQVGWE
jgi:hypothetical protein